MVNSNLHYISSLTRLVNSSKKMVKKEKFEFARKMRYNPTFGEKRLRRIIKNNTEYKFRRQVVILGYIVDFYFPEFGLIIEVDGKHHEKTKKYDVKRDIILENKGFVVLRVTNKDVINTPSLVLTEILRIGNLIGRLVNPI